MSRKRKRFVDEDSSIDDVSYLCEIVNDDNFLSDKNIESEDSEIFVKKSRKHLKLLVSSESEDVNNISTDISLSDHDADDWQWEDCDNEPKVWNNRETAGINSETLRKLGKNASVLDVFYEFLTKDFWEMIANETNRYARQVLSGIYNVKAKKLDKDWYETNSDEIQVYFALCFLMTQVKKSVIQMNWSKRKVIETPIYRKTMPYKRFRQISRFLHFTNIEDTDKTDQLNKISGIVKYINDRFEKTYTPEEDVSLHESLMKFRSRLGLLQFNRMKRARYGIKYFKLCESKSGYCIRFQIYTGKEKVMDPSVKVSERVVMELAKPILYKGYTLYLDNMHSSPQLFSNLHSKKINVVGTAKPNQKNMPKEFLSRKLQKGEIATQSTRGLLALKWRDKRDVYMLSTKHKNAEMTNMENRRLDKENAELVQVIKPKCILEYNSGMEGLDRHNQRLSCFTLMRKFFKGYKKMFFYILDITLFNAYVLFCKLRELPLKSTKNFVDFQLDIAESLFNILPIPHYNVHGRPSQGDTPLRLQAKHWAHFPQHIAPTKTKKNPTRECKVCRKHKKRSETTWECKQCLIALHVPQCFEIYHTILDY